GGIYGGAHYNCAINYNVVFYPSPSSSGAGVASAAIYNCTVTSNTASGSFTVGGGISSSRAFNSIICNNLAVSGPDNYSCLLTNCAVQTFGPGSFGANNLLSDPQLLDDYHVAVTSPCRASGSVAFVDGVDIDGEAWTNPPSIGCDEPWAANIVGPLAISI